LLGGETVQSGTETSPPSQQDVGVHPGTAGSKRLKNLADHRPESFKVIALPGEKYPFSQNLLEKPVFTFGGEFVRDSKLRRSGETENKIARKDSQRGGKV